MIIIHGHRLSILYALFLISVLHRVREATAYYNNTAQLLVETPLVRDQKQADAHFLCERPSDVYECEVPEAVVPPEATKSCDYRSTQYHEQVYRWVAGRGCILFTPDFLFVAGENTLNLNAACRYGLLYAPCLELPKEDGSCGCYPFDPGLENVAAVVRNAMLPAVHGRWERCFYAAADCCSQYLLKSNVTGADQCGATFDGWSCWQAAETGTVPQQICSEFAYSAQGPSCYHYSSKSCNVDGTWEIQTDYSTCSISPRLLTRYRFYIGVLSFSTTSCLPAVFIFCFYKRLMIPRLALHRNLLIAIIVRNILVIISRSEIYIDELTSSGETVMSTHAVACRVLAAAERVAANAVFACMLVEAIFLHRLIVAVFRQKINMKWLYAICAVVAVAPVAAWTGVMSQHDDHSCWLVYTVENIQWVLDAPRLAVLLINTGLFADVLRVLLTKIRNSENANQLSTVKASLFLMPIFGSQFLLTAFRPNTSDCTWEQIYYYISYSVEGLQGFIVALLYCYVNKEVHMLIKSTYKKTENSVVSRMRRNTRNVTQHSLGPNSDRRMTYSTGISNPGDLKETNDTPPEIHNVKTVSLERRERLAHILEPVYENLNSGVINKGCDSIDRSEFSGIDSSESGMSSSNNEFREEEYFANSSSGTIASEDWIECISQQKSDKDAISDTYGNIKSKNKEPNTTKEYFEYTTATVEASVIDDQTKDALKEKLNDPWSCVDAEENDMLNEIMQYMVANYANSVMLDPTLLCPNRCDSDQIVFVDN